MILIIDNYDSFVYNIYHAIAPHRPDVVIHRNDALTIADIRSMQPDHIILSPGPGRPENAGICVSLIRTFYQQIPILGICLGHQAIAVAFNIPVQETAELMHGKTSEINVIMDHPLFHGCPPSFPATRYHSLIVHPETTLTDFEIIAQTGQNLIMGISHKNAPLWGVQYHPESILTVSGGDQIRNFIETDVKAPLSFR